MYSLKIGHLDECVQFNLARHGLDCVSLHKQSSWTSEASLHSIELVFHEDVSDKE